MLNLKKPTQLTHIRPPVYCKSYFPILGNAPMMLYSGGGVGKSFSAIREAIVFVNETGRKAALWLTEDPEGENKNRYERLIKGHQRGREFFDSRIDFIADSPIKLTRLRDGNAILTDEFWQIRLDLFDYSLIVFDPLLQFQGGDENNNTHAGVLMGALKDWTSDENKTVLLLHHASRTADGRLKPRGAGEWVNGTRGCYEISIIGDDKGNADPSKKDSRKFRLVKDNGLSFHFRDSITGLLERVLPVFPEYEQQRDFERDPNYIRMSIAGHNDARNPKGFEATELPFTSIHNYVRGENCYSPYLFAGGHRKNENNLGYSDVLCLDFDDGMTLDQGIKKFAKFKSLLVTTRSHQKDGKGDRFRVFLKLKTPLTVPACDFPDFMDALFKEIGSVDPATKDMARFFFASPEDAFFQYSESQREFDWEDFYKHVKKKKIFDKINSMRKQEKTIPVNMENTLPKDTMFTTKRGQTISFEDFRNRLSYGGKEPVQCRNGHGHNGGQGADRNAAAFVKKHDNGNVFYHCSGAKCAGEGTLFCEE